MFGGLGIGALINTLATNFMNQKSKQKERSYEEKKAAYIGLLTSLHNSGANPSDENSKAYALWQTKCDIFGSDEVSRIAQEIVDTNGHRKAREEAMHKLLNAIRQDLNNL